MTLIRGTFTLVLCLALAASRASAQDTRLADRLPHGAAVAVQVLVDSAASATLPTEPLIKKALEGQSKGADSGRIVAAVRALAANLALARSALGAGAPESDLVAGAAALRAGATPATLGTLKTLRNGRPLGVALSVYADLLSSGLGSDRAWAEVRDLAERRVPDSAFLELRDRTGAAPDAKPLPHATRSDGPEHPNP